MQKLIMPKGSATAIIAIVLILATVAAAGLYSSGKLTGAQTTVPSGSNTNWTLISLVALVIVIAGALLYLVYKSKSSTKKHSKKFNKRLFLPYAFAIIVLILAGLTLIFGLPQLAKFAAPAEVTGNKVVEVTPGFDLYTEYDKTYADAYKWLSCSHTFGGVGAMAMFCKCKGFDDVDRSDSGCYYGGQSDNRYNWSLASKSACMEKGYKLESGIAATKIKCVDNTPPTLSITYPANNANVSGTVTISASASDAGAGMAKVDFILETNYVIDTSPPYEWSLDTTKISEGQHVITVMADDLAGNSNGQSITITVDRTLPTASFPYLTEGENINGIITVGADAKDNPGGVGVAKVEFYLDGQWQATDSEEPYVWVNFDTTKITNRKHIILIAAEDFAGNRYTKTVSVIVDNLVTIYCMGDHKICSDLNPIYCTSHPGCHYDAAGDCIGAVQHTCASLTEYAQCTSDAEKDAGCTWTGPIPTPCSVTLGLNPSTVQAGGSIAATATVQGGATCGKVSICTPYVTDTKTPDANGIVSITYTAPSSQGAYSFTAALTDKGATCTTPEPSDLVDTKTLTVTTQPTIVTVSGKLTDQSGTGISGAKIELCNIKDTPSYQVTTDSNGGFSVLNVPTDQPYCAKVASLPTGYTNAKATWPADPGDLSKKASASYEWQVAGKKCKDTPTGRCAQDPNWVAWDVLPDNQFYFTATKSAAGCTPAAATFTAKPTEATAQVGTELKYTLTLTNKDSAGCQPTTYWFNVIYCTADWNCFVDKGPIALSPGQSVDTILTVNSSENGAYTDIVGVRAVRDEETGQQGPNADVFVNATFTTLPTIPCNGTLSLTFEPTPATINHQIKAKVSGLANCDGNTATFDCTPGLSISSCTYSGDGCTSTFTPSKTGTYSCKANVSSTPVKSATQSLNVVACVMQNPVLTIEPPTFQKGARGDALLYMATVNNSNTCGSTFKLNVTTCLDKWSCDLSDTTLDLDEGESATAMLAITSPTSTDVGTRYYTHQLNASTVGNNAYNSTVDVNYQILKSCERKNPTLKVAKVSQSGLIGQERTYSIKITNLDLCSSYYTLDLGCEAGWDCSLDTPDIYLLDKENADFTATLMPDTGTTAGVHNFILTAVNSLDETKTANATLTYNVTGLNTNQSTNDQMWGKWKKDDGICDAKIGETISNSPADCAPPVEVTPVCGNNIVETGEDCDGSSDARCPSLCNADCTCPFIIGDGICDAAAGESSAISSDCAKKASSISLVILLVAILGAVGGVGYYFMKRRGMLGGLAAVHGVETATPGVDLGTAVNSMLSEGYNPNEIHSSLEAGGWSHGKIESAMASAQSDQEALGKLAERQGVAAPVEKAKASKYVKKCLAEGYDPTQIRTAMISSGWPADAVDGVISKQTAKHIQSHAEKAGVSEPSDDTHALNDYVKKEMNEGHTKQDITQVLKKAGWSDSDIKKAFGG